MRFEAIVILAIGLLQICGAQRIVYNSKSDFEITLPEQSGLFTELSSAQSLLESYRIWRDSNPAIKEPLAWKEEIETGMNQNHEIRRNESFIDQYVTFPYSESGKMIPYYLNYSFELRNDNVLTEFFTRNAARCHRRGSFHALLPIEHKFEASKGTSIVIVRYFGMYCRNKQDIVILAYRGYKRFYYAGERDFGDVVRYVAAQIIHSIEDDFYVSAK